MVKNEVACFYGQCCTTTQGMIFSFLVEFLWGSKALRTLMIEILWGSGPKTLRGLTPMN